MTLDDVVPHPQYRMTHRRTVSAPPAAVWDELCRVTMSALPMGHALKGARLLPARLAGRKHRPLAGRTFLDVTPIPVVFSERPQVVISAGLSQAWRLLGGLTPPRLDAAGLRAWSDPGWIKVAMEFRLEPTPAGLHQARHQLPQPARSRACGATRKPVIRVLSSCWSRSSKSTCARVNAGSSA